MTLLNCTPFYDEQGRHHYHDSNTTTSGYECSNGHNWVVKSKPSCWCGWPNKPEEGPPAGNAEAAPGDDEATTVSLTMPKVMLIVLTDLAKREGIGLDVLVNRWVDARIKQEATLDNMKEKP